MGGWGDFRQTEMWLMLSLVKDSRFQSPQRSRRVIPDRRRSYVGECPARPPLGSSRGARVLFERRPGTAGTRSFDEHNAAGPRQQATAKTADEVRQIHLGYVPIGGKYVGRRPPRAGEMIRFLGRRDFHDPDPAAQIRAEPGSPTDGRAAESASQPWRRPRRQARAAV